jgi:hypothetical protein
MDIGLIWVNPERFYFCNQDWTTQISLIWLKKLDFTRTAFRRHCIHAGRSGDRIDRGDSYRIRLQRRTSVSFSAGAIRRSDRHDGELGLWLQPALRT